MFERQSIVQPGEGGDQSLARDSPMYIDAANMSHNLARIDLAPFLQSYSTERRLFVEIHTLLCMHASVALNMPVQEVTDSHDRLVAYQIGQRIFTAADVSKLCGEDSAFRESIANLTL